MIKWTSLNLAFFYVDLAGLYLKWVGSNKVKYLHKFKTPDIEIFHLIRKFHYDICVLTLGKKIPANCTSYWAITIQGKLCLGWKANLTR